MNHYAGCYLLRCTADAAPARRSEAQAERLAEFLHVPPGFKAEILVADIPKARSMTWVMRDPVCRHAVWRRDGLRDSRCTG